jgi:hypothetical protein
MKMRDLTGQRFGRLTAQWPAGRGTSGNSKTLKKFPQIHWLCSCDCGNLIVVPMNNLTSGNSQSCGCLHKMICSRRLTTHGKSRTPEHIMLLMAKVRAKKKRIPFEIDLTDIVIPETCPLLGIPLTRAVKKLSDNSPTLDRREGAKGYVKGNVRVISYKANRSKSNLTLEEMKLMVENWNT